VARPFYEYGDDFPIASPLGIRPNSTSSCVLLGYVNQRDNNLLSDSLGVATERINCRIRQGIILQSGQIALFNPRGGLDISQTQPESFTGGLESRNRFPQHSMPGFRPPPTGNQFRLFLFDLLTEQSMANSLLFRKGFIDAARPSAHRACGRCELAQAVAAGGTAGDGAWTAG